jgi:hypothetical protein
MIILKLASNLAATLRKVDLLTLLTSKKKIAAATRHDRRKCFLFPGDGSPRF